MFSSSANYHHRMVVLNSKIRAVANIKRSRSTSHETCRCVYDVSIHIPNFSCLLVMAVKQVSKHRIRRVVMLLFYIVSGKIYFYKSCIFTTQNFRVVAWFLHLTMMRPPCWYYRQ